MAGIETNTLRRQVTTITITGSASSGTLHINDSFGLIGTVTVTSGQSTSTIASNIAVLIRNNHGSFFSVSSSSNVITLISTVNDYVTVSAGNTNLTFTISDPVESDLRPSFDSQVNRIQRLIHTSITTNVNGDVTIPDFDSRFGEFFISTPSARSGVNYNNINHVLPELSWNNTTKVMSWNFPTISVRDGHTASAFQNVPGQIFVWQDGGPVSAAGTGHGFYIDTLQETHVLEGKGTNGNIGTVALNPTYPPLNLIGRFSSDIYGLSFMYFFSPIDLAQRASLTYVWRPGDVVNQQWVDEVEALVPGQSTDNILRTSRFVANANTKELAGIQNRDGGSAQLSVIYRDGTSAATTGISAVYTTIFGNPTDQNEHNNTNIHHLAPGVYRGAGITRFPTDVYVMQLELDLSSSDIGDYTQGTNTVQGRQYYFHPDVIGLRLTLDSGTVFDITQSGVRTSIAANTGGPGGFLGIATNRFSQQQATYFDSTIAIPGGVAGFVTDSGSGTGTTDVGDLRVVVNENTSPVTRVVTAQPSGTDVRLGPGESGVISNCAIVLYAGGTIADPLRPQRINLRTASGEVSFDGVVMTPGNMYTVNQIRLEVVSFVQSSIIPTSDNWNLTLRITNTSAGDLVIDGNVVSTGAGTRFGGEPQAGFQNAPPYFLAVIYNNPNNALLGTHTGSNGAVTNVASAATGYFDTITYVDQGFDITITNRGNVNLILSPETGIGETLFSNRELAAGQSVQGFGESTSNWVAGYVDPRIASSYTVTSPAGEVYQVSFPNVLAAPNTLLGANNAIKEVINSNIQFPFDYQARVVEDDIIINALTPGDTGGNWTIAHSHPTNDAVTDQGNIYYGPSLSTASGSSSKFTETLVVDQDVRNIALAGVSNRTFTNNATAQTLDVPQQITDTNLRYDFSTALSLQDIAVGDALASKDYVNDDASFRVFGNSTSGTAATYTNATLAVRQLPQASIGDGLGDYGLAVRDTDGRLAFASDDNYGVLQDVIHFDDVLSLIPTVGTDEFFFQLPEAHIGRNHFSLVLTCPGGAEGASFSGSTTTYYTPCITPVDNTTLRLHWVQTRTVSGGSAAISNTTVANQPISGNILVMDLDARGSN